jgi:hypothetical protein
MGVLEILLFGALYFLRAGIDVVLLFLLTRVLAKRWQAWWLVEFDAIGRRFIDGLLARIADAWYGTFHTRPNEKGTLIIAMVLFSAAQLLIAVP